MIGRAGLFGLAFLASVAFLPGAVDPAMSIRWAVLAVGVPLVLMLYTDRLPAPLGGAGLAFVLSLVASLAWTTGYLNGFDEAVHLVILAACFCLGASVMDLRPAWQGLAAGVTVSAALAIAQAAGFTGIEQAVSPAGLFMNKNMLAEAGLVALIPAVLAGSWLAIGPAVAVVLGASKAAYGACALVLLAALWGRRPRLAQCIGAVLVVAIAAYLAFGDLTSLGYRLEAWRFALAEPELLGHGIGSYTHERPGQQYAHSEYLHFLYEHGLLAIVPVVLLGHLFSGRPHDPESLVLLAVLVVGLFAFPLRLPLTGFAAALAAGHLARTRDLVRAGVHARAVDDAGHRAELARG